MHVFFTRVLKSVQSRSRELDLVACSSYLTLNNPHLQWFQTAFEGPIITKFMTMANNNHKLFMRVYLVLSSHKRVKSNFQDSSMWFLCRITIGEVVLHRLAQGFLLNLSISYELCDSGIILNLA